MVVLQWQGLLFRSFDENRLKASRKWPGAFQG